MCSVCWNAIGFSIAAIGSTLAMAAVDQVEAGGRVHPGVGDDDEDRPTPRRSRATTMPAKRCARGEIRSQP